MRRNVILNKKGVPEVQPDEKDLRISKTGVIYLMKCKESDENHLIYKAQRTSGSKKKNVYSWVSLWNSICYTDEAPTLEQLIANAIKKGYCIKQCNFDDLLIHF